MKAKDEAAVEVLRKEMRDTMEECNVPEHLREGLCLYFLHGYPPGSFLASVLRNDLCMAVEHADPVSLAGLRDLIRWLRWHAHGSSHGSYDNYRAWTRRGGLKGE